jgi:ABC-type uncharacterized transport system auxiliary subunit
MNALRLLAVFAIAALAACSIIPDPPPAPRIYPLRAEIAAPPANGAPATLVIGVPEPALSTTLSGSDIVWVRDGVLGFMERAAWPSRTPIALQALLVETIDGQKRVLSAVRSGEGPRADAELRWQVNDFQIEEGGGRLVARFSAEAKLMNGRSRTVFAARRFEVAQPLEQRSGGAAASALAKAARMAAGEIGSWAADAAIANAATAPAQASAASSSK